MELETWKNAKITKKKKAQFSREVNIFSAEKSRIFFFPLIFRKSGYGMSAFVNKKSIFNYPHLKGNYAMLIFMHQKMQSIY